MNNSIQIIPWPHLALAFIPVCAVVGILYRWSLGVKTTLYALLRMLIQLTLVGYLLAYIFEAHAAWIVLLVLAVMILTASWIALRTTGIKRAVLYRKALTAIVVGGGLTLVLVTQAVLQLEPWFWPRYVIPLAGMVFANAMNSISLAAERVHAEIEREVAYAEARGIALKAALIPITNSLFAVGLVSLPGMMTGQILSGVSPLIAARYQIMVMCMIYGSAGISAAVFLKLAQPDFQSRKHGPTS